MPLLIAFYVELVGKGEMIKFRQKGENNRVNFFSIPESNNNSPLVFDYKITFV